MVKSKVIILNSIENIEKELTQVYPGLLRWAIVKITNDKKFVVSFSYCAE